MANAQSSEFLAGAQPHTVEGLGAARWKMKTGPRRDCLKMNSARTNFTDGHSKTPRPRPSPHLGNNHINGLTAGAGGDTLAEDHKPFQFMFTWQMRRRPFEEVAISPEPGAVSASGRERKMFASNNFRKPSHRFVGIHWADVIHEQPVVY